jgi:hypothetical protein
VGEMCWHIAQFWVVCSFDRLHGHLKQRKGG